MRGGRPRGEVLVDLRSQIHYVAGMQTLAGDDERVAEKHFRHKTEGSRDSDSMKHSSLAELRRLGGGAASE